MQKLKQIQQIHLDIAASFREELSPKAVYKAVDKWTNYSHNKPYC